MGLVILVTAREHDAQYQWTMNELAALEDGLEPSIIELVRHRGPVTGLPEKEAVLIEFGRELFAEHNVSSQTYARALEIFGERDLVDFVNFDGAACRRCDVYWQPSISTCPQARNLCCRSLEVNG